MRLTPLQVKPPASLLMDTNSYPNLGSQNSSSDNKHVGFTEISVKVEIWKVAAGVATARKGATSIGVTHPTRATLPYIA